jgi:hypothetical protein
MSHHSSLTLPICAAGRRWGTFCTAVLRARLVIWCSALRVVEGVGFQDCSIRASDHSGWVWVGAGGRGEGKGVFHHVAN